MIAEIDRRGFIGNRFNGGFQFISRTQKISNGNIEIPGISFFTIAPDTFIVDAGASLSSSLDGGAGGGNQLTGPNTGATFTVSSVDGGRIQETGAAVSTVFKNVGQLQGGSGADSFLLTAAGGLSTGIDGGGDVNTLHGPAGATYTVTGADTGTLNATLFSHIGKLLGTSGAADTFVIAAPLVPSSLPICENSVALSVPVSAPVTV